MPCLKDAFRLVMDISCKQQNRIKKNFQGCGKDLTLFLDLLNPAASITRHSHLESAFLPPLMHARDFKVSLSDCSLPH